MRIEDNCGAGKTVVLRAGDDLAKVPRSHRKLLSDPIRTAFIDPPAYFHEISKRCTIRTMSRWLRVLAAKGEWELELNIGYTKSWTMAGYFWRHDTVRGACIGLPERPISSKLPVTLRKYYSLVDAVNWQGFSCAGALRGANNNPTLSSEFANGGSDFDPNETYLFGGSLCGDVLVYTLDNRAGWIGISGENSMVTGTISQTLEWVFGELLAGRSPEHPRSME